MAVWRTAMGAGQAREQDVRPTSWHVGVHLSLETGVPVALMVRRGAFCERPGTDQVNAPTPVMSRPTMSVWIVSVPS